MAPIAGILIGVADMVITKFIEWQGIRARDKTWNPGPEMVQEFLDYLANDTTEKIQAEVAAEQGKTWADRKRHAPPTAEELKNLLPPHDAAGGS